MKAMITIMITNMITIHFREGSEMDFKQRSALFPPTTSLTPLPQPSLMRGYPVGGGGESEK
jgi:hypothetical protein